MESPTVKTDDRSEFVQSLERGLSVLRAFSAEYPSQTLAETARITGLTRASARRFLHTLEALGYLRSDGKVFELTPKVLDLGYAYISSMPVQQIAQPHMESLSAAVHESVSVAVLEGADIVYLARVPTKQIMAISLSIGSRLPALTSSMGRAILGDSSEIELRSFIATHPPEKRADRTVTNPDALVRAIQEARKFGYVLLDQELENGVRSVAAPLRDSKGRAVAAINVSTHAGRVTLVDLRNRILPQLLQTAANINAELSKR
jgi:IclR family transcriptional regulator, pca regulon regulatory protein